MKRIKIFFALFIFFISYNQIISGDFKVLINYMEGEKSKDSWTKSTTITVDDYAYSYSSEGSGKIKNSNDNKNGSFTDEQLSKIKTFVLDYNLNTSDSLFDESTKYKGFERFTNAQILIYINNASSSIKFNGDIKVLEDKPLYKNAISFIELIKSFIVSK